MLRMNLNDSTGGTKRFLALVGDSGAGKTELANALTRSKNRCESVRTCTTRAPEMRDFRNGNGVDTRMEDGDDYIFVDDGEFDRLMETGALVAPTSINNCRYGVPVESIAGIGDESVGVVVVDARGAVELASLYAGCAIVKIERDSASRSESLAARFDKNDLGENVERERMTMRQVLDASVPQHVVHNGQGGDGFAKALARLEAIAGEHLRGYGERSRVQARGNHRLADQASASGRRLVPQEDRYGVGR